MDDFLRDINYMIYIQYIYHSFEDITCYEDEFGVHMFDNTFRCSFYFTFDKVVELKRDEEDNPYYLHFEFINIHNALRLFNDFVSYIKKQKDIHILICCSSAMTSSYLCELLNTYGKEHNENVSFHCCSYSMIEELYHKYDYVLLAPQVSYKRVDYTHIPKLDVIETNDYATYNCYRIIEYVKKKVEG